MGKRKQGLRGFTLIELMITLVIAIVVLSLGIPGIARLKQNSELTTLTNELVSALSLARSEAIKRGDIVKLEPSADWSSWVMKVDDGDADLVGDGDETVVRLSSKELPAGISVVPEMPRLTFDGMGSFTAFNTDDNPITDPCVDLSSPGQERSVLISTTGNVTSCKVKCSDIAPNVCN